MTIESCESKPEIEVPDDDVDLSGVETRVTVSEKAIINSRADLNQLVPFKYEWAWLMYLEATENHWMPTEYQLKPIAGTLPVSFALHSWETVKHVLPITYGMSIYRHFTNPECRQYILRQMAEQSTHDHACMHIRSSVSALYGPTPEIQNILAKRNAVLIQYTKPLADPKFDTSTQENAAKFMLAVAAYYVGYTVSTLTCMMGLVVKSDDPQLSKLADRIVTDVQMYAEFAINAIATMVNENTYLERYLPDLKLLLAKLYLVEYDLCRAAHLDYAYALGHINHVSASLGIPLNIEGLPKSAQVAVKQAEPNIEPKGALSWD